jgi:DNA-binding response OmpR family regulator
MVAMRGITADPSSRKVWKDGEEVVLSRKEFDLLYALMSRPGEIVTRSELMRDVWGTTFFTSAKTIDVHLGWLRRKIGDDSRNPTYISTIRGRGLRFEAAPGARSIASA